MVCTGIHMAYTCSYTQVYRCIRRYIHYIHGIQRYHPQGQLRCLWSDVILAEQISCTRKRGHSYLHKMQTAWLSPWTNFLQSVTPDSQVARMFAYLCMPCAGWLPEVCTHFDPTPCPQCALFSRPLGIL